MNAVTTNGTWKGRMVQKAIPHRPLAPAAAIGCAVTGCASVQTTAAELPALRQRLAQEDAKGLPASLFKQADDQTIVGLAAVCQAVRDFALDPHGFTHWGLLGAPRHLGRAGFAAALARFKADGAWGVTPHLVAHRSLHSLPGVLSLALKLHGPNLGVGGGPGAAAEALRTAISFLHADQLPGVWVVLTGWRDEPAPTPDGQVPADAVCQALALALIAERSGCDDGPTRLRLWPGSSEAASEPSSLRLEALAAALAGAATCPVSWIWYLEDGTLLELEHVGARGGHR